MVSFKGRTVCCCVPGGDKPPAALPHDIIRLQIFCLIIAWQMQERLLLKCRYVITQKSFDHFQSSGHGWMDGWRWRAELHPANKHIIDCMNDWRPPPPLDYLYVCIYLQTRNRICPSSSVWLFISQSTFLFRPDASISSHGTMRRWIVLADLFPVDGLWGDFF